MAILWDLVSVVIIIICIYLGVKKGFISSLISVLAYVVSAVAAWIFAPMLSGAMYTNFFAPVIKEQINQFVVSNATTGADILGQLPDWISAAISSVLPDFAGSSYSAIQTMAGLQGVSDIGEVVSQTLASPISQVISWFVFIILFLIFAIVLKQVAKLFKFTNMIPLVGTVNMVLGGGLGVFTGLFAVLFVSLIASLVGILMGGEIVFLQATTIDGSGIMGTLRRLIFG